MRNRNPKQAVGLSTTSRDRRVKVVFANRYFAPDHSATSQILSDLTVYLAKQGFEVHVVASRQRYDNPAAHLPKHETIADVRVHRVWTSTFGRANLIGRTCDYLSFYVSAGLRLVSLLRTGDVVIAKTDPPLLSVVVAVCSRIRGARQINWLQDLFPEVAVASGLRLVGGKLGLILIAIRNWSLRRAEMNVTIVDSMAARVEALGVSPECIRVIPNWSNGLLIKPLAPESNPLRSEWGVADKFVVGYSGNMGRVHDMDTVIRAAELMRDEPAVRFVFVGAGKQRAAVESAVRRLGLDNVLFQPYQPRERLGLSLPAPDIHLVSLLPELEGLSVPSKFYGVAAAGRPTVFVGDPGGAIGSAVHNGECGVCIHQGDASALVAAVRNLQANADLRHRMGRNARRLFERYYDLPIASEEWHRLLCAVLHWDTPADESDSALIGSSRHEAEKKSFEAVHS